MRHAPQPRTWTLVVPIDPNPAEEQWFAGLGEGLTAPLGWLGKTWLEEQLARFPDIIRYFSGAEQAGLAARFGGQARRLNEIDPYYWFEFGVSGDAVAVTAHPKYPDAARERAVTVTATLQFGDSPAQQESLAAFEDFLRFGTPVIVPAASITMLAVDARQGSAASSGAGRCAWTVACPPARNR